MIERLEVAHGPGTVIRYGSVVAWAAPSASPALVSFLAQSARNLAGSASGGRQMADHIANVLRERDPEPQVAFAIIGPDSDGWASLLHGPVQAWDGQRWLAPTPTPGWLHAVITPKPSVMVNAVGSPVPTVSPDSMWDLEGGVVPGSGFVLFPGGGKPRPVAYPEPAGHQEPASRPAVLASGADQESTPADEATLVEAGAAPHAGALASEPSAGADPTDEPGAFIGDETAVFEPSPPTEVLEAVQPEGFGSFQRFNRAESPPPAGPAESGVEPGSRPDPQPPLPPLPGPPGSIDLRQPQRVETRPPLPAAAGPDRTVPGAPVVAGILCEHEHLNRPGLQACVRCGAALPTDAQYTVSGTRPSLGTLVGDDGTIWRLDTTYLVGSNPASDPTVRGGVARPLPLGGEELSPAHAEIRLADWDVEVVDRSSTAGTFVFEPGAATWMRLRPYEPRTLKPGTHVAFGQRIVTYLTPWVGAVPQT